MRSSSFMTQYKSFAIISSGIYIEWEKRLVACAFIVWARIYSWLGCVYQHVLSIMPSIQPQPILSHSHSFIASHRSAVASQEPHTQYIRTAGVGLNMGERKSRMLVTQRNNDIIVVEWIRKTDFFECFLFPSGFYSTLNERMRQNWGGKRENHCLRRWIQKNFMLCLCVVTTKTDTTDCWPLNMSSCRRCCCCFAGPKNHFMLSHSNNRPVQTQNFSYFIVNVCVNTCLESSQNGEMRKKYQHIVRVRACVFIRLSVCVPNRMMGARDRKEHIYLVVFNALECLMMWRKSQREPRASGWSRAGQRFAVCKQWRAFVLSLCVIKSGAQTTFSLHRVIFNANQNWYSLHGSLYCVWVSWKWREIVCIGCSPYTCILSVGYTHTHIDSGGRARAKWCSTFC